MILSVIIDYLTWFDGLHARCRYVDDNHYHFTGPFRSSGTKKHE